MENLAYMHTKPTVVAPQQAKGRITATACNYSEEAGGGLQYTKLVIAYNSSCYTSQTLQEAD